MRSSAFVADVRGEPKRHRMTNATQKPPRHARTVRVGREMRSPDADKSAARRELRTLDEDRIAMLRTMLERTPGELRVQGFNPETVELVRQVQEVQRDIREEQERYNRLLRDRQAEEQRRRHGKVGRPTSNPRPQGDTE
jgi:hypothetical protein